MPFTSRAQSQGFSVLSPVNESKQESESNVNSISELEHNSTEYINVLRNQQLHANQSLQQDIEKNNKLLKHLPINERFNLNKEGKVLTRFQQRLNDWEKIKNEINIKINKNNYNNLLMNLSDDYRPKVEEYDLIQAAVPPDDFNGENGWQKSLRGGGSVKVAIGNIYSGLECEVERQTLPPIMVRKPKPLGNNSNKTTFLEETEGYIKKKKLLTKQLSTLRPHILSYENADALVITATDLFQWAIDSSMDYYNEKERYKDTTDEIDLIDSIDTDVKSTSKSSIDSAIKDNDLVKTSPSCQIEYLSSVDLLFQTIPNKTAYVTISYRNTGKTVITYEWKKVFKISTKQTQIFKNVINSANAPKELLITNQRQQFFCSNPKGIILPNDTVTITFSYINNYITGNYNEDWTMECTPYCSILLSNDNKQLIGKLILHLHSYNINDYNSNDYIYNQISTTIRSNEMTNYVSDILNYCIERIRNPVTISIINDRIINYFQEINIDILSNYKYKYTTISNINKFYMIYLNILNYYKLIKIISIYMNYINAIDISLVNKEEFEQVKNSYNNSYINTNYLEDLSNNKTNIYTEFIWSELNNQILLYKDETNLMKIKNNYIFPEINIEVFDEIEEKDISPKWNYSIQNIFNILNDTLVLCYTIEQIEKLTDQRLVEYDKDLIKQHRQNILRSREEERSRRIAERDELSEKDEDDEEFEELLLLELNEEFPIDWNEDDIDEENNDVDDTSDQENKIIVFHSLIQQTNNYLSEVSGNIVQLIVPELPTNQINYIIYDSLCNKIDKFDDYKDTAMTKSGITKTMDYQPYSSPYTTIEGKTDWEYALSINTLIPPKKLEHKSSTMSVHHSSSKKLVKEIATKEQVAVYYNNLYESISTLLYDMMDKIFVSIDEILYNDHINQSTSLLYDSYNLFDIPTINLSDLTNSVESIYPLEYPLLSDYYNKIIYYNVPTNLFQSSTNSFYDVKSYNIKAFVKYIKDLANYGSRSIVLLYDNKTSKSIDNYLTMLKQAFDIYLSIINKEDKSFYQKYYNSNINIDYDIQVIESISQLKYNLLLFCNKEKDIINKFLDNTNTKPSLLKHKSTKHKVSKQKRIIPIYLLNDLNIENVIPNDIPPDIIDSDDDDVPIDYANDEYKKNIINKWNNSKPHLVTCQVNNKISNDLIDITVFADKKAAINDIYNLPNQIIPSPNTMSNYNYNVWIDDNILSDISTIISNKFISKYLREMFIWCGIIQLLPLTLTYFKPLDITNTNINADFYETLIDKDKCIYKHLERLFPHLYNYQYIQQINNELISQIEVKPTKSNKNEKSKKATNEPKPTNEVITKTPSKIVSIAIIGGKLREDKLQYINQMIDLVDVIYLSGEISIPFISYLYQLKFLQYNDICNNYLIICKQIITKARMRGTQLIVPSDLNIGDEIIPNIDSLHSDCSISFGESVSCDEGYDYKGDNLNTIIIDNNNIISGYIYDIGKNSIESMKQLVKLSDLVIIWGITGVCEYSIFQTSYRQLVEITSAKPYSDRSVTIGKQLHTILIGESTVEWYSRIVDTDGEYTSDLTKAGIVSYLNRNSYIFTKIISLIPDRNLIDGFNRRISNDKIDDWVFNGPPPQEIDEDEDT